MIVILAIGACFDHVRNRFRTSKNSVPFEAGMSEASVTDADTSDASSQSKNDATVDDSVRFLRWVYQSRDEGFFFNQTFQCPKHVAFSGHPMFDWHQSLGDEPAENKERRMHWIMVVDGLLGNGHIRKSGGDLYSLTASGMKIASDVGEIEGPPVSVCQQRLKALESGGNSSSMTESSLSAAENFPPVEGLGTDLTEDERKLVWRVFSEGNEKLRISAQTRPSLSSTVRLGCSSKFLGATFRGSLLEHHRRWLVNPDVQVYWLAVARSLIAKEYLEIDNDPGDPTELREECYCLTAKAARMARIWQGSVR